MTTATRPDAGPSDTEAQVPGTRTGTSNLQIIDNARQRQSALAIKLTVPDTALKFVHKVTSCVIMIPFDSITAGPALQAESAGAARKPAGLRA